MKWRRIFLACGISVVLLVVLCIVLPLGWLSYYYPWQYCWFPPQHEQIQVLVSACTNPRLHSVSPDGRYMVYSNREGDRGKVWIQNLVTGQRSAAPGVSSHWLSDTLVPLGSPPDHIWDITDSTITPLQPIQEVPNAIVQRADGSNTLSPQVVNGFRAAETVYYFPVHDWAIALASDFKNHPEQNYMIDLSIAEPKRRILAKAFLEEYDIPYQMIESANAQRSHDGTMRFGFLQYHTLSFLMTDGRELARIPLPPMGNFDGEGWTFDDSGVVGQFFVGGSIIIFEPAPPRQPILKVNVPSQFLPPTLTP